MKDIIFILLIILFVTLFVFGMDRITSGQGRKDGDDFADKKVDVEFFRFPVSNDIGVAWRMWDDDEVVATHYVRVKSIQGMTWLNDTKLIRSNFLIAGKDMGHDLGMDEFMEALKKAELQESQDTLPTMIEIYDAWEDSKAGQ